MTFCGKWQKLLCVKNSGAPMHFTCTSLHMPPSGVAFIYALFASFGFGTVIYFYFLFSFNSRRPPSPLPAYLLGRSKPPVGRESGRLHLTFKGLAEHVASVSRVKFLPTRKRFSDLITHAAAPPGCCFPLPTWRTTKWVAGDSGVPLPRAEEGAEAFHSAG